MNKKEVEMFGDVFTVFTLGKLCLEMGKKGYTIISFKKPDKKETLDSFVDMKEKVE